MALSFAQRAYVLKQGEIVAQGSGEELLRDPRFSNTISAPRLNRRSAHHE